MRLRTSVIAAINALLADADAVRLDAQLANSDYTSPACPGVLADPTPADSHAVRIVILAIAVDAPVVHGVGADEFKLGVGHYEGAANPGETGNLVLSVPGGRPAHRCFRRPGLRIN